MGSAPAGGGLDLNHVPLQIREFGMHVRISYQDIGQQLPIFINKRT